jgi:hypothetical protein
MNMTFGIGKVLATGFRIWARNFLPFILLTALIFSPLWIWGISTVQGEFDQEHLEAVVRFEKYSFPLMLLLNILVSAALTYGVVMELQGQRASLGACITTGLTRFLPALGTMLLMCLCIGGVFICIGFPLGLVFGLMGPVGVALTGIGVWIAFLWILSMLSVATQASVIERPGVLRALGRSRDLTQGHKFAISIVIILVGLLSLGLQTLLQNLTLPNIPLYIYVTLAREILVGSLASVMVGVAYYFLRAEKEGTSADELAAVFG